MPHDAARARLDLARPYAPRRPEAAIGEAETALDTFERIGARNRTEAVAHLR